jgi:predicted nucleic acid binding AN1-type Zn finger protein
MKSNELLLDDIFSQLANMPVRCNRIQYVVSCSMGHEFKSKIKLISGKKSLFLKESKIKMVVISYLLFVFTLIIFIRTEKPGGGNNENKIKKVELV